MLPTVFVYVSVYKLYAFFFFFFFIRKKCLSVLTIETALCIFDVLLCVTL